MADRMTATPSQEWTDHDTAALQWQLEYGSDIRGSSADRAAYRFVQEILRQRDEVARLRAENAQMSEGGIRDRQFAFDTIESLRSENERLQDRLSESMALQAKATNLASLAMDEKRALAATREETPSETDAAAKEQWRSDPPYPIWLVERADNGYAEWLKSSIGLALVWTTEASEALWHETEDEAHAMIRSVRKSGHYMPSAHAADHRFLVRSTTSRSRVSDNG